MADFIAPWSPNFTNEINSGIAAVEGVLGSVIPAFNPTPPAVTAPAPVTPTTVLVPMPVPQTPSVTGAGTSVGGVFQQAIEDGARRAWPQFQEQLRQDFNSYIQTYGMQILTGNVNPPIPDLSYEGQSLTKSAAKGHAWRTFLTGMAATSAAAVLSTIGTATNLDFFSKEGWIATGSLAVGTLVQSVISYVGRLQITPPFEKQMMAASPDVLNHLPTRN